MKMQITNEAELRQLLNGIPRAYQPRIQKKIITNATAPLLRTVRATTPVSARDHRMRGHRIPSGTLKKSMGLFDSKRTKNVTMYIGARVKGQFRGYAGGWYAHFVGLDRRVYSLTGGRMRKGDPWVQNAWASGESTVRRKLNEEGKAVFEKAVSKLRMKGKL